MKTTGSFVEIPARAGSVTPRMLDPAQVPYAFSLDLKTATYPQIHPLSPYHFAVDGQVPPSAVVGTVSYNGTVQNAGAFDGGTSLPVATVRLNFDGYLLATRFGAGVAPTARIHAAAGVAAAGGASVKIDSGVVLTTPEDGALEYDGTHLYFTIGATRHTIV